MRQHSYLPFFWYCRSFARTFPESKILYYKLFLHSDRCIRHPRHSKNPHFFPFLRRHDMGFRSINRLTCQDPAALRKEPRDEKEMSGKNRPAVHPCAGPCIPAERKAVTSKKSRQFRSAGMHLCPELLKKRICYNLSGLREDLCAHSKKKTKRFLPFR